MASRERKINFKANLRQTLSGSSHTSAQVKWRKDCSQIPVKERESLFFPPSLPLTGGGERFQRKLILNERLCYLIELGNNLSVTMHSFNPVLFFSPLLFSSSFQTTREALFSCPHPFVKLKQVMQCMNGIRSPLTDDLDHE